MNILAKTFFVAGHETTILGAILIALSFVLLGYFIWVAWVNAIPDPGLEAYGREGGLDNEATESE